MEHLSSSARAKAKLCLSQTIAAGQKLSWEISADLIHQFLVRAKRMATAKAKGKKPPRWRPLFTKVAAHKASFPPSQRTESYAASFLAKGTAITSAAFAGEAASLGIPTALRADTWLRVLQMRVRLGKKGIASLVDNTPLADHGTPQPPPVGSFWVPEAAPSHSSPRVRQGPSPDPVPDIVHPEPPAPEPDPPPPAPPLLGPLTELEATIAGDMDPSGPLGLVVSHPRRLQDGQWYHNDIFLILSEELAMWATITTGRKSMFAAQPSSTLSKALSARTAFAGACSRT